MRFSATISVVLLKKHGTTNVSNLLIYSPPQWWNRCSSLPHRYIMSANIAFGINPAMLWNLFFALPFRQGPRIHGGFHKNGSCLQCGINLHYELQFLRVS